MKNVAIVRERVIARTLDMLEHLRLQLAYPEPDMEVLRLLERPQQFDLAEDIARYVMEKLGHTNGQPSDPRFDKTRRALNEVVKQGPRRMTQSTLGDIDAKA